jgi:hypothetical protein
MTADPLPSDSGVPLPCPFCGRTPWGVFGPEGCIWRVECSANNELCSDWSIEIADSESISYDEGRARTVAAWNRRAALPVPENFEAWIEQRFGPEQSGVSPVGHGHMLEAWQAALRAALPVVPSDEPSELDQLRARVEVAEAGYHAAVSKAQWQASTNRELNECQAELSRLRALLAAASEPAERKVMEQAVEALSFYAEHHGLVAALRAQLGKTQ